MKSKRTLRQVGVALMLLVAFLCQETWALAGTTGGLSGNVKDEAGAPVLGASITATAPSGTSSTMTDAAGHFVFLSLAPDTYLVTMTKTGYSPTSLGGITVFADQTQTVSIATHTALKSIGTVTSRSAGDLVKSGTTSDVYSVNEGTAQKLASLGGGGNLNNAYSAIYSQPGVESVIGNYGAGQVFYIRGSNYNQVGYEFDGVPVNRAFDNYNGSSLSNLGQQELQVYTGSGPAGTSTSTVGGYINQVIKTGTYPGTGNIDAGVGGPIFYHRLTAETGGASPNRLFSYYAGVGGYNQQFRLFNQQNGGNLTAANSGLFNSTSVFSTLVPFFSNGVPSCNADGTSPSYGNAVNCVAFGPAGGFNYQSDNSDRESVFNLHFGIPHKHDQGRDDIQLLYTDSSYLTGYAESINDLGGAAGIASQLGGPASCVATGYCGGTIHPIDPANPSQYDPVTGLSATVPYEDGKIFAPGTTFGQHASTATVVPYLFPDTGLNRLPGASIPNTRRNTIFNDSAVIKAQYQKNIGSNAYARIYGYSLYSDWLNNGPSFGSFAYKLGGGYCCSGNVPRDYELSAHTRGGEFQFSDQVNSKNLVTATANYVSSNVVRFNNGTMSNGSGTVATSLTDGTNCYSAQTGSQGSCLSGSRSGTYGHPMGTSGFAGTDPATGDPTTTSYNYAGAGGNPCAPGGTFTTVVLDPTTGAPISKSTGAYQLGASSAACTNNAQYLVTVPGERGTYNSVRPEFSSQAINDEFRPNDRLLINAGLRFEQFKYNLAAPGSDFPFWYNAAANSYCYNTSTLAPQLNPIHPGQLPPATPLIVNGQCQDGFAHPTLSDPKNTAKIQYAAGNGGVIFRNVTSPRLGFTYSVNPETVIRGTIGRFAEPVTTATVQYLDKSGKSSAAFNFANFFQYGYNTAIHPLVPQISDNADLSLEKRLHGTDISFKISPFYRYTTYQLNTISIGALFNSSLNDGTQRTYGLEVAVNKGDPSRNGLSGQLAYTYTHARLVYTDLSNGRNGIDPINDYIVQYNRLTSACAGNTTDARCVGTGKSPLPAAAPLPCYAPNSGNSDGTASPDVCAGGASTGIANPYYNAPLQPLLDRGAAYDVYPNATPAQPGDGGQTSFGPNTFSGFLNYKQDRLTLTPNFQLAEGNSYGSPGDVVGIDPRACGNNQATSGTTAIAAASGGSPNAADFTSCNASVATGSGYLAIPNPQTGRFATFAQYRNPWQLELNLQAGYDVSKHVHANLILANLVNRCFGGSSTPWSSLYAPGKTVCGYSVNTGYFQSNFYNGGSPNAAVNGSQLPVQRQPYAPFGGLLPFNAYLDLQFKI